MMAQGTATLRFTPPLLAEALQLTLALTPIAKARKLHNVKSPLRSKLHSMPVGNGSSLVSRTSIW
jgi:hypothetical protein